MDPLPPSTTPPSMHLSWNSCNLSKQLLFDSDSSSPGVFFLLLVDMGLGAAVGGMRLEINTGYSCYLTAARRCQGCFFSLVDLGPGAVIGGMRIEINTVLSCYLICNDS